MTDYTHAQFRIEAFNVRDGLRDGLGAALEHMHAGLVAVGAGTEQRAESNKWITGLNDLVTEGRKLIGDHDPRLTRVGEAQRAAGGRGEVAAKKRYNQL